VAEKQKALKLDLPGAPLCAQVVIVHDEDTNWTLPGYYHPEIATPLGELGEPTLDQAKLAVKAGAPVKLVDLSEKDAAEARKWQSEQHAIAKNIVREAQRSGDDETRERAQAEAQA
jgi:hypothetical protein